MNVTGNLKGNAVWGVCCMMVLAMTHAAAQYEDPRLEPPAPARYAGGVAGHRAVTPQGSGTIDFSTLEFGLILHQEPVELQFGYASYSLGSGDRTALTLSMTVGFDVPLQGPAREGLFLPLVIVGDYAKAEATGLERDNFNVGSIGAATGLKLRAGGTGWTLELRGALAAQYSFEGFGVGTGFSPLLLGDATVMLRSIPVLDGLAAGYRFRLQRWDMSNSLFDYRSMHHGVFLGVLF